MFAIRQIDTVLNRQHSPEWILEGDIKGSFDHISHDLLIENIPIDKTILRKWLKCGAVFNGKLFPTEEGTPLQQHEQLSQQIADHPGQQERKNDLGRRHPRDGSIEPEKARVEPEEGYGSIQRYDDLYFRYVEDRF